MVSSMASSHVFAGVGGYYGGNQGNLAGVFRRDVSGADWQHVLTEPEAYTVFVHPRDPSLVLAGTKDGIYRSTDRGATFKRANFPDDGVQIWSVLPDPADPQRLLAGGSPASIYRSIDAGGSWTRRADPKLPDRGKAPFAVRVMRFARHPRRPDEIYAALEVGGVMRSTDGGESWSDCSEHLIRLSVEEPRLRSKIVSDTEAEGMLDGHAICMSAADPDAVVLAVRMGLFRRQNLGGSAGRPLLAVHLWPRHQGVAPGPEHALRLPQRRRVIQGRCALPQPGYRPYLAALRQGAAARHLDVGQPASRRRQAGLYRRA